MASQTDICNMALSYLGANQIIEISDASPEATLCNLNWESCLEAVLEDVNWTFATKRYKYDSPRTEAPKFGWSFSYALPAEVLRVIEVNENKYEWALEDGNILTDMGSVEVLAIVKVTDTTKFPPQFVKALAAFLASEIALPLTNSPVHQQAMGQQYMAKRKWAQGNDGRQGRSKRRISSEWRR